MHGVMGIVVGIVVGRLYVSVSGVVGPIDCCSGGVIFLKPSINTISSGTSGDDVSDASSRVTRM